MKKIIDNKNYRIYYLGDIEELKIQLKGFYESFGMNPDENLENLEKIIANHAHFGPIHERIYYNKKRLLYGVNSGDEEEQKFIFLIMKKRAEKVDEKILKNNPEYLLEIEEKQ